MFTSDSTLLSKDITTIITDSFGVIGGVFNQNLTRLIKFIFSVGGQGFAYDPNDLTTLYQDAAGTIPVTTVGQPVGLMLDKSGCGNHAYQTNSASRPILRKNDVTGANYLEFDGVDDRLITNSFPAMGLATTIFAGSKANNTGTGSIVARGVGGYIYQTQSQVTLQSVGNSITVPISGNTVITAKYAASGTGASLEVNNIIISNQLTTDRGYNNSLPVVIGAFSTAGAAPLSGHIYVLIGIGKVVSDDESSAIEKEIAKRVGVTLNV